MTESHEGKEVPNVPIRLRENAAWKDIQTHDWFKGKTVAVFSLPGAFTPTCSSSHVPRYDQLYGAFKDAGVDAIVCVSVNDAFVMQAWQEAQGANNVLFMPDGNGVFTEGMGMLVDKSDLGFGKRSWRYSMLVKNAVVEKMFIEPEKPGDPFENSDADTMLKYVGGKAPADIALVTRAHCSFCVQAKDLLKKHGLEYSELPASPRTLRALPGGMTTPQVYINGESIGGFQELEKIIATLK